MWEILILVSCTYNFPSCIPTYNPLPTKNFQPLSDPRSRHHIAPLAGVAIQLTVPVKCHAISNRRCPVSDFRLLQHNTVRDGLRPFLASRLGLYILISITNSAQRQEFSIKTVPCVTYCSRNRVFLVKLYLCLGARRYF